MHIGNKIEQFFKEMNLIVFEWQMNDSSVGINEGWVLFKHKQNDRVISWDYAVYHLQYKSSKKEILKDSSIYV